MEDPNSTLIPALVVFLVLFAICREIVCWYWKINERTDHLKQMKKSAKRTNELLMEIKDLLHRDIIKSSASGQVLEKWKDSGK